MSLDEFSRDWIPLLGLLSIFFVWWQLRETAKWNRYNFAYKLSDMEKVDDLEYKIFERLQKHGIEQQNPLNETATKTILNDHCLNRYIHEYLNSLERFCIALRYKALTESMAYDLFSDSLLDAWEKYQEYIAFYKKEDKERFENLESVYYRWHAYNPEYEWIKPKNWFFRDKLW